MELTFIQELINPITLAACLCVGFILKNLVPSEKVNRFIPLIVGLLGVCICAWANWAVTPEIVTTGLVSGLASTGLYEAFKNLLNMGAKEVEE